MANRVILVIDDEKDVCRIIKEGLERLGKFKIISACDGNSGILAAKQAKPDLVLLDINMPFINGLRVLEVLKEDAQTFAIPIVMLTGLNDSAFRIAASRSYCEDYITKPISVTDLKIRIDAVLTRYGI
jgi:DNA-binding response OmpR family regulator